MPGSTHHYEASKEQRADLAGTTARPAQQGAAESHAHCLGCEYALSHNWQGTPCWHSCGQTRRQLLRGQYLDDRHGALGYHLQQDDRQGNAEVDGDNPQARFGKR
jgi:hypothetical protein